VSASGRVVVRMVAPLLVASGARPPALDLDDDVPERPRADVPEGVPQRALVPAHDLARRHLDPVHRAVGVRPLDDVSLDDDRGVVEVVGVPAGLLAQRQLDPLEPHAVVLVDQLGSDRVSLRVGLVHPGPS